MITSILGSLKIPGYKFYQYSAPAERMQRSTFPDCFPIRKSLFNSITINPCWQEILRISGMDAKDKNVNEVITPEPPQVMDPSKPPVTRGSKKSHNDQKGDKRKGEKQKPKPKHRKM